MNQEHTDKLFKDFPKLYRNVGGDPTETCMSWGFECSDGWFELIYNLSEQITDYTDGVVAAQVKEKFGTLRFYVDNADDEVYDMIRAAEDQSSSICDICGADGETKSDGWVTTRCEEHTK